MDNVVYTWFERGQPGFNRELSKAISVYVDEIGSDQGSPGYWKSVANDLKTPHKTSRSLTLL